MKIRHKILKLLVNLALGVVALSGSASVFAASPADEIRAAVQAAGTKADTADAKALTKAFSAVLVKAREQDFPQYVTAAINLRPDFAPPITVAALRAHRHAGNELAGSSDWVAAIVRAAVAANHAAVAAIVRAAIAAEPGARQAIVAVAMAAAPEQRAAIEQAAAQTTARRRGGLLRPEVDARNSNSNSSAAGTINPANMSAQASAVSPEKQDRQTICHNGNTLVLPRPAAEAHLRQHAGDYPGACH